MGSEKPYRNRLRLSAEVRQRWDAIGEPGVDETLLAEQRLDLQLAWAPHPRVFLSASLPLLRRELGFVNLARTTAYGMGDAELRLKVFLWQDRALSTRHLLSLLVGVKLPVAPPGYNQNGALLLPELQAGTGSFDPILGMAYALFLRPWSAYFSAYGTWPLYGPFGFTANPSLRLTNAVQYQVSEWFAPRLGVDLRIDGKAREDGAPVRDSGGAIVFASVELLFSPAMDLLLYVTAKIPVVQALSGFHREGPFLTVGVAYDAI